MKITRRSLLFTLAALPLAWLVKGCSQLPDSTKCVTDRVHSRNELASFYPGKYVICGDTSYSEVNPAFAEKWHSYTSKVMNLLGMSPTWSEQFDCNRFANVKLTVIHIRFLVDTWHARQPGAGAAAGEAWYIPNAVPGGQILNAGRPAHAIIATIEGGQRMFRDIYTSKTITLTQAEYDSIFLLKF